MTFERRLLFRQTPEVPLGSLESSPEAEPLTINDVLRNALSYLDDAEDIAYLKSNAEAMKQQLISFSYAESLNALSETPYDMQPLLQEIIQAHKENREPQLQELIDMSEEQRDAWRTAWRTALMQRRNQALPKDERLEDDHSAEFDRALAESQGLELAVLQGESVDVQRTFATRLRVQRAAKYLAIHPEDRTAQDQLGFLLLERLEGSHLKKVTVQDFEKHGSGVTLDLVANGSVVAAASIDLTDGQLSVSRALPGEERLNA